MFFGGFRGGKGGGGVLLGVFLGFLGVISIFWRNFRVKYRNFIPIIAFRGRSIIISAL